MMYAILERNRWDGRQSVAASPGALIVHASRLPHHVEQMTGRSFVLRMASVARKLRAEGRVYVASEGQRACRGVIVECVETAGQNA